MTSLLSAPTDSARVGARHRRPLVLLAALGGATAAAGTLVVCLALGVLGWYLSDAGAHGVPRDGLRTGALAWLMAHGSGVRVNGALVSVVPLGLSAVCAWAVWRVAHRVGDSVSGHGPDADRIADGERDWTVPAATTVFALGYAVVTGLTLRIAGTREAAPSLGHALLWSLALCLVVGGPAVALGSGRLAVWSASLPPAVPATLSTAGRIVRLHLLVALAALVVALLVDFPAAANVLSQLHTDTGESVVLGLVSLAVLPNAVVFSSAYLLGPGFAVGTGTLVSPSAVVLGALPLFPLLAALPDPGRSPAWVPWLVAVPPLVAAVAAAWTQRRHPTTRWEQGALRGCAGGVLAGLLVTVLALLAGGSVGPGRMQQVGPFVSDVLVHAVPAFGIGGLLGGLAMTWWQRRGNRVHSG